MNESPKIQNEHIPECSICLMPIKYGNPPWKVHALECAHSFHRRCILHWGRECPECRHGGRMLELVTVNIELHTSKYRRCFTIKILRSDRIDNLFAFIRELTKISMRHLKITSIAVKNNTFSVLNDPPRLDESIQSYVDRRENILNKLMGFSLLYDMTIHFDVVFNLAEKINANPLNYKFSDPKDVYIELELEESIEESEEEPIDFLQAPSSDMCCALL